MTHFEFTPHPERLALWIHKMRTTLLPQGKEHLAVESTENTPHYCCLGLGCLLVPGLEVQRFENADDSDPDNDQSAVPIWYFGSDGGESDLAPREFINWLAGDDIAFDRNVGYDLAPDFPRHLRAQGTESQVRLDHTPTTGDLRSSCSAAAMNDHGFTFKQIADVFDYFGVGYAFH